jgi:hypothetical protein
VINDERAKIKDLVRPSNYLNLFFFDGDALIQCLNEV